MVVASCSTDGVKPVAVAVSSVPDTRHAFQGAVGRKRCRPTKEEEIRISKCKDYRLRWLIEAKRRARTHADGQSMHAADHRLTFSLSVASSSGFF